MNDSLGDRMKEHEKRETGRFMPLLPVVARLDGRAFHSWCRGLDKPFDMDYVGIMQRTTKKLVEETGALIGYTQSDEISLVFYSDNMKSQIFFDGKRQKMTSVLASMCTAYFEANRVSFKLLARRPIALFDCRVWQVPTKYEVANYLIWRENDATRNSIMSAGQAQFSFNEMQGLKCPQVQEKLFQEKGINWNDYPVSAKRGSYFRSVKIEVPFATEEIEKLPPKHAARENPDLLINRKIVRLEEFPKFSSLKNREEVIFEEADPLVRND